MDYENERTLRPQTDEVPHEICRFDVNLRSIESSSSPTDTRVARSVVAIISLDDATMERLPGWVTPGASNTCHLNLQLQDTISVEVQEERNN